MSDVFSRYNIDLVGRGKRGNTGIDAARKIEALLLRMESTVVGRAFLIDIAKIGYTRLVINGGNFTGIDRFGSVNISIDQFGSLAGTGYVGINDFRLVVVHELAHKIIRNQIRNQEVYTRTYDAVFSVSNLMSEIGKSLSQSQYENLTEPLRGINFAERGVNFLAYYVVAKSHDDQIDTGSFDYTVRDRSPTTFLDFDYSRPIANPGGSVDISTYNEIKSGANTASKIDQLSDASQIYLALDAQLKRAVSLGYLSQSLIHNYPL